MGKKEQVHPVKELIISLPGRSLKFYVTADFESLLTDLEDEDKIPCWAEIWPAAYGLARHIWEHVVFNPGERVLELGAGMGLPGIVCGIKGAHITLSDFNEKALEMAGTNARANGVVPDFLLADWRNFPPNGHFDTILAADILYDPQLNPYLGKIFCNNLQHGGRIFVAHPGRPATRKFLQSWYEKSCFTQRCFTETVELKDELLPYYDIAVHLFTHYQRP